MTSNCEYCYQPLLEESYITLHKAPGSVEVWHKVCYDKYTVYMQNEGK